MVTPSILLITLTIITSAATISQGLKCYNCMNCTYPNTGTAVQCSAAEVCIHLKTDFNRSSLITMRGCAELPFNVVNSCREGTVDGTVTIACFCNTDLCNGEEYPNNALTKAAGEGTKPGLKCYSCVLGDCNNKSLTEMQCSKGFDSCSTSVIEHEILGLPLLSKYCSSGLSTRCVTSGNNSLYVCKGNLCNGYGTTTFELQQTPIDKATVAWKVLNVLNREVHKNQFYLPIDISNFFQRLRPPNENTIDPSAASGFILKLLVLLCILCLIGCSCIGKVIDKCLPPGSETGITYASLPQLKA